MQTPGFMGCGKVFLTSKKFLFAEGGYKRLVWMTKELKTLLAGDLKKRFAEQGAPDLLDKIIDETIAIDAHEVRRHLEENGHPALAMEDMGEYARPATPVHASPAKEAPGSIPPRQEIRVPPPVPPPVPEERQTMADQAQLEQLKQELIRELKQSITAEIVGEIVNTLNARFLGKEPALLPMPASAPVPGPVPAAPPGPTAAERISRVDAFQIKKEQAEVPVWQVRLGATREEGGTRGRTHTIGGETCMPFHLWEGAMPHRPLVAMEVFDAVSDKYPQVLRSVYGELLHHPADMARVCVETYGADLISVRLDGTHPERGNRTVEQAVGVVRDVLKAVPVPLIITGHSSFDKNNEVIKAVAQACSGERLLLNWVEQDNYRTIAGAALAFGHAVVSQSPIDVNIAKQMNILLTNMDVKPEQIVMDPMTGATGYGIEYTYSVMERIRLTALNGDKLLAGPMIVSPGQECAKIKESRAAEEDFPAWGAMADRAALWELTTAVSFVYAGADLLIMYNPRSVAALKQTISRLLDHE